MLKYVLAFFAFILVTLASVSAQESDEGNIPYFPDALEPDGMEFRGPASIKSTTASVSADEGYIPYFPDALEPDGIGFRGPSSIRSTTCWTETGCDAQPAGSSYSQASSHDRTSPVTLEYRKNYFFKKLIYTQVFADFGQTQSNAAIFKILYSPDSSGSNQNWYPDFRINSEPFLIKFLTSEEKSIISSLPSIEDGYRILDLETEFNFILFGMGIGLDLWFLEFSAGAFLMYHDTSVSLRLCKSQNTRIKGNADFVPTMCNQNPDDIINLNEQHYSGFGIGQKTELSLVFLQTDNWRITMDSSSSQINRIWDSSFKKVNYRGLDFYPDFTSSSTLNCSGAQFMKNNDGEWHDIDCKNAKGEDHRKSTDYTYGLKITYYFQ
tara:strand:+ start:170 stop:1309 length:1140 start_codon:yes stop_codon:yes gene_type:complete